MIKKSIVPAMFCSLLSTTALAGNLVIGSTNNVLEVTPTPASNKPALIDIKENSGAFSVTIGDGTNARKLDISETLSNVSGGVVVISGNEANAYAGVNVAFDPITGEYTGNNLNWIEFDDSSVGELEALLAAINSNSGTMTALIDAPNLSIGADVVDASSELEIRNNDLHALVVFNGQDNYITGDASNLDPLGSATDPAVSFDGTTGLPTASGDVVLVALQQNETEGVVDSSIINTTIDIEVGNLTDGTMSITGNTITAEARFNELNNVIDLEHTGVDVDIALAALQTNEAEVNVSVESPAISLTASQYTDGNLKIANNDITAISVFNVMNNQINSDGGGADTHLVSEMAQFNTGAATSEVSGASFTMDSPSTAADFTGDMSLAGNSVNALLFANVLNTTVDFTGTSSPSTSTSTSGKIGMYQSNSAAMTASITSVAMTQTVAGSTSSTGLGAKNNSINASAMANSGRNIFRIR